jgi:hypothetical protein
MDFGDALPLFIKVETLGDKVLTKLVAREVVMTTTERLQFERCTRKIQNIMFNMLEVCEFLSHGLM